MLEVNKNPTTTESFKAEYFADLAHHEEQNFWFKGRNRLIVYLLKKYCGTFKHYLEIGCGTGFVLSGVATAFPQTKIQGSELFSEGLEFAAKRVPSATCLQMDARNIPYEEEFDVVGSFDVLEHIQEDDEVLTQIHKALTTKGLLVISVPQHAFLWSITDEYACHVRRYSAAEIEQKVSNAGFTIIRSTSFVAFLLPAMFISRRLNKSKTIENYDPQAEFNMPRWMNFLFELTLSLEIFLIQCGINFPLGGSRFIVAQKNINNKH